MFDGSALSLDENLEIASELLEQCARANVVLEIERGVVGGSGSAQEEIREAVSYGVVKMSIDTDTEYAFTRAVAGHMFASYDGALKVDGGVGRKKAYDPRSWGRAAEAAMAARVAEACEQLGSAGRSLLQ